MAQEVDECPMSTEFKTRKKYLFQPVPIPTIAKPLLEVYLMFLRPKMARLHNIAADDQEMPMLLGASFKPNTSKGNRIVLSSHCSTLLCELANISLALNVMRVLVRFATLYTPYYLSSTTVRALVATTTARKRLEGRVSKIEQQAIENISGHTMATCKAFYTKNSRYMDSQMAKAVFEREFGADPSRIKVSNDAIAFSC